MAHGIYTSRDFQVATETAWHKLTTIAKPTREHFPEIVTAPLFWNVDENNMDSPYRKMTFGENSYFVPLAKDDGLPVAPPFNPESYTLFTPREAWDWVTDILSGTGYNVQSIGMLWNRSFWFMSTELTELKSLSIGDGRQTDFQLNFSGGLDRSKSPQCELSSIVAVCHNTISLSRATGKVLFKERATAGFTEKLNAAKAEVEKAVGMAAIFKQAMDGLANKPCSPARAERIFAGYVTPEGETKMSGRTKNNVAELTSLHTTGIGNKGESEWDLLNAYTQFITHGAADSKVSAGRRFASSEFGNGADNKADFARLLAADDHKPVEQMEARGELLLAVKD